MLDFRIHTFLAVCRTLNYTRAAEELSITQPAVSQHISYLERHYGAKLFSYRGKRLSLTRAGEILQSVAASMEHDERLLEDSIASAASQRSSLSLGVTHTVGEYLVAAPLARYVATHPDVDVRIEQNGTEALLDRLRAGRIDCALIEGYFDKRDLAWRVFSRQELVAVRAAGCDAEARRTGSHGSASVESGMTTLVAPDTPTLVAPDTPTLVAPAIPTLAAFTPVRFEDLLSEHILVREPGSGTRAVLEHALAECNLTIESFARVTEVSSLNIIKAFVAKGVGISFLYDAAVRDGVESGALERFPLAAGPIEHDITFVYLKGGAFAKRMERFFDDLAACTGEEEARV